jgi:hypothetical protein
MRYLDVCSGIRPLGNRSVDLIGMAFSRLTVVARTDDLSRCGERLWLCRCECGQVRKYAGSVLKRGKNKSCGCLRRARGARLNYKHGLSRTTEYEMLRGAKKRAQEAGVPFSLIAADIVIPTRCPVLDIALDRSGLRLTAASPTLDRIIPAKGYVAGNVAVISWRANKLKSDGTPEEIMAVARWLEREVAR